MTIDIQRFQYYCIFYKVLHYLVRVPLGDNRKLPLQRADNELAFHHTDSLNSQPVPVLVNKADVLSLYSISQQDIELALNTSQIPIQKFL